MAPDGFTVAQAVNDWLRYGLSGRQGGTVTTKILCRVHIVPALGHGSCVTWVPMTRTRGWGRRRRTEHQQFAEAALLPKWLAVAMDHGQVEAGVVVAADDEVGVVGLLGAGADDRGWRPAPDKGSRRVTSRGESSSGA